MFEGKLASVLNGVLGEYVHGISTRDLNVAVFKGDKSFQIRTDNVDIPLTMPMKFDRDK